MEPDDMISRFEGSERSARGIEPLDDYVLIEPVDEETETSHGLIIPASADASCRAGVVVAAGEEAHGISPGDKVLYPRGVGFELRLAGEPKRLVPRHELIARVLD